jgi:hypothetical protein
MNQKVLFRDDDDDNLDAPAEEQESDNPAEGEPFQPDEDDLEKDPA